MDIYVVNTFFRFPVVLTFSLYLCASQGNKPDLLYVITLITENYNILNSGQIN